MSDNMEDEMKTPVVTESPENIWLQYGDIERDSTHDECYRLGDVTWCEDSQFDSDVKYVRADIHKAQSDELDSLRIALKESESGELRNALAVGQAVIELQEERKELDRLRAANARLQAWHDAVMGELTAARIAGTGDASVTLYGSGLAFGTELITRPQPLAKE